MDFIQQSFGGGMNLSVDDTRVPADAYRLAFNVRNRHDSLETVKRSEVFDMSILAPRTDPKVQGILFVDPYFLSSLMVSVLKCTKTQALLQKSTGRLVPT